MLRLKISLYPQHVNYNSRQIYSLQYFPQNNKSKIVYCLGLDRKIFQSNFLLTTSESGVL